MMEQGPERTGESRIDFESNPPSDETSGLTSEQVRATLQRLEEVLAEDTPQKEELSELPVNEDDAQALYKELKDGLDSSANIELLSPDEVTEEIFTEDYIAKAKEALERVLSEDEPSGTDSKSEN